MSLINDAGDFTPLDLDGAWKSFRSMRATARVAQKLDGPVAAKEFEDGAILKDVGDHGTRLKVHHQEEEIVGNMYANIVRFAKDCEGVPKRGSIEYDLWLDHIWKSESILAGAVYSMEAKMQSMNWKVEGGKGNAKQVANMLSNARYMFNSGWSGFIASTAIDFYTQDNGIFWDVTRAGNGRYTRITDLATIDTRNCMLTGSWDRPMYYCSTITDQEHWYKPWEYIHFGSMPLPNELEYGRGFCAVSRASRAARLLMALHDYDAEKLSNLPPEGVASVTGMTDKAFRQAIRQWMNERKKNNSLTFPQVLWLIGSTPNAKVDVKMTPFSTIPESFDRQTVVSQYVNTLALCFGVDTREFWAISSGALGTAAEAEVQHMKARGKGGGEFISLVERHLNYELPDNVLFSFDTQDIEEDMVNATVAGAWINAYLPLVYPTNPENEAIIDIETFKRMMADARILPEWAVGDDRVAIMSGEVHKDLIEDVVRFAWMAGKLMEPKVITLKGGKGSGWHAPPKGTHSGDKHRAVGSGKAKKPEPKVDRLSVGTVLPEDALDFATSSMAVRVQLHSGARGELAGKDARKLAKALQRHPQAVLDMLEDYDISIRVADSNAAYNKEYVRKGFGSAVAADRSGAVFALGGGGRESYIMLRPGIKRTYVDHEIGHAVYDNSRTRSSWARTAAADARFDQHTAYSKTNFSEAFAESYMAYTAAKGIAKSPKYAKTFAAVEEVLRGIE